MGRELQRRGDHDVVIVLAGNKADLEGRRKVFRGGECVCGGERDIALGDECEEFGERESAVSGDCEKVAEERGAAGEGSVSGGGPQGGEEWLLLGRNDFRQREGRLPRMAGRRKTFFGRVRQREEGRLLGSSF